MPADERWLKLLWKSFASTKQDLHKTWQLFWISIPAKLSPPEPGPPPALNAYSAGTCNSITYNPPVKNNDKLYFPPKHIFNLFIAWFILGCPNFWGILIHEAMLIHMIHVISLSFLVHRELWKLGIPLSYRNQFSHLCSVEVFNATYQKGIEIHTLPCLNPKQEGKAKSMSW